MKKKCEVPCEEVKSTVNFVKYTKRVLLVLLGLALCHGAVKAGEWGYNSIWQTGYNDGHKAGYRAMRSKVSDCYFARRLTDSELEEVNKLKKEDRQLELHARMLKKLMNCNYDLVWDY